MISISTVKKFFLHQCNSWVRRLMTTVNLDRLSQEQNQEFNTIAEDVRAADYDRLIVSLSEDHLDNIHWIVGSIASRNKYSSPLFIRCCQIAFVKRVTDSVGSCGQK